MFADELREHGRPLHEELHRQPFLKALLAGTAERTQAIGFLRSLCALQQALEQLASQATNPHVAHCWRPDMVRWPVFDRELSAFDEVPARPNAAVQDLAAFIEELTAWARTAPHRLLGPLYVLEGSTIGGVQLAKGAAKAVGAPEPLRCLCPEPSGAGPRFDQLRARLGDCGLDAAQREEVAASARRTFEAYLQLTRQLGVSANLQDINEDAGVHAITWDPRETAAAFAAGATSWREAPYYRLRYGERGRRFTRSDSLWLVHVTTHAAPAKQLAWLSRVLSGRGMPTVLLEDHLFVMADELTRAVPCRAARYQALRDRAEALRAARQAALPPAEWAALHDEVRAPHRLGRVVAGAVADHRNGMTGCAPHIAEWLETGEHALSRRFVQRALAVLRP